ncbi:DMT family transporter [Halomonas campaniensis]|uniref:Multidrug DMT transporter permease n=1 Tax=Halomonas campaniensis TaxID=213554 RepID=A0A246RZA8_9GAMM|nr:DMT family transporter [Halomonas campaniensis]OWV29498.1 multidrug DMT transporter permease [Halomonas campaniensis]
MRAIDYLRLLSLAAIWGASFLFMRIAPPAIGPINTAFFRVFFGLIGLAIIILFIHKSLQFRGKLTKILILGAINSGIPFLMYSIAATLLPAGYSAILNATTPLMGAMIGFYFFSEGLSLRKLVGIVLGIAGIIIITSVGDSNIGGNIFIGVSACIIATIGYGFAGFLTRKWITHQGGLDSTLVAFGSQLGATTFLAPFMIWNLSSGPSIDWLQGDVWISLLAVGFVCTSLAYILYFRLIADIGPLRSLTVTFLVPPFAVLWGYLVLDETISSGFLAGSLIVLLSVWLIVSPDAHKAA